MPGRRPRRVERSAGPLPGAWGGYSVRRSGRFVEAAIGFSLVHSLRRGWPAISSAYQAMDLSRPKRMMSPRAAARRMAQVSVDRLKVERMVGVDIMESPKGMRWCTRKNVWLLWNL